jgi:gas vesicle protein
MSKELNSFLKGLATGVVAGAVAGILLAPKSGKETREDIKKFAGEVKEKALDTYQKAEKSLQRKVKSLKALGKKIDEKKYAQLVDEIVDEYKSKEVLNSEAAKSLGKQLKADWGKIRKALTA